MTPTLAATDNAPIPTLDTRRITETDADYVRLHTRYARKLRGSIATLTRELRRGEQGADTRFINRHIGLMRDAYLAAHEEGQRDYWQSVSLKTPPIAPADEATTRQRLAWFALGSVLKMAREATLAAAQSGGHITRDGTQNRQIVTTAPNTGMQTFADGGDPLAQWQASTAGRVDLQAAIGWSGIQDGYLLGGRNDGAQPFALVWWELGIVKGDHCDDCRRLAFDSPYNAVGTGGMELDQTPGDGRTQCGANCKCNLTYKPLAEREANAVASAWVTYYNDLKIGLREGPGYTNTAPEGFVPNGPEVTLPNAWRPPETPLIIPPRVPIEVAQKQALDEIRGAQRQYEAVRGTLPADPWYIGDDGGPNAVPSYIMSGIYEYLEQRAAILRLWAAQEQWYTVNGGADDAGLAEWGDDSDSGGAVLLNNPYPRNHGKFGPGGMHGEHVSKGGGRGRGHAGEGEGERGLTGERQARSGTHGGGGGKGGSEGKLRAVKAEKLAKVAKVAKAEQLREVRQGKAQAGEMHRAVVEARQGGGKAGGSSGAEHAATESTVHIHEAEGYAEGHARATLHEVFGRTLSDHEIGSLVGAQHGDHITIKGSHGPGGRNPSVSLTLRNGGDELQYRGDRTIELRDGKIVMHNEMFHVARAMRGEGIGTRVFAAEVAGLQKAGVDHIITDAVGHGAKSLLGVAEGGRPGTENGYYTWARLGYNAHLTEGQRAQLPESLRGARDLHDLMRTREGRQAWKDYGSEVSGARFDLHAGSHSHQVLQAYLEEKGQQLSESAKPTRADEIEWTDADEEAAGRAWDRLHLQWTEEEAGE